MNEYSAACCALYIQSFAIYSFVVFPIFYIEVVFITPDSALEKKDCIGWIISRKDAKNAKGMFGYAIFFSLFTSLRLV
jgi:hypothetical protein